MIYLEVSTSCKTVRNTGIQRITRKLFQELRARVPVTPISWNILGRRFQRLTAGELATLEAPFHDGPRVSARPELRGENPLSEAYRLFFRHCLSLEKELRPEDVFLMPDVYRDARTRIFPDLIAKIRGRSLAIFHDAAALQLPALAERSRRGFRNYIESLAAFDLVICVSNSSHEHLQILWGQYGVIPTETVVERWPVEVSVAERRSATKSSRALIVCVGSFEERKNHLALLRGAAALWRRGLSFELCLIGRSAGFGRKVVREIGRLQSEGWPVRWLKHVDDETLHRAYLDCRFTVYPSLAEGFGLPIMESLWHGKPCVCGGNGALGEAARGGGCLIVDQTSDDSLADGINALLLDQPLYLRLCQEARGRQFRSWSDYTDKLLAYVQPPRVSSVAVSI
ncbi:MAG TPA: glycosyltransferase [Chthoniobacterales bacterium]|nr:glycosyltransferase [Chthoniobacterales bacterium]